MVHGRAEKRCRRCQQHGKQLVTDLAVPVVLRHPVTVADRFRSSRSIKDKMTVRMTDNSNFNILLSPFLYQVKNTGIGQRAQPSADSGVL